MGERSLGEKREIPPVLREGVQHLRIAEEGKEEGVTDSFEGGDD